MHVICDICHLEVANEGSLERHKWRAHSDQRDPSRARVPPPAAVPPEKR